MTNGLVSGITGSGATLMYEYIQLKTNFISEQNNLQT